MDLIKITDKITYRLNCQRDFRMDQEPRCPGPTTPMPLGVFILGEDLQMQVPGTWGRETGFRAEAGASEVE